MENKNQVFIGMIPDEDETVQFLLEAARDVKMEDSITIDTTPIKDEETGEELEDHVTVYTTKPELSKQLWERYEFRVKEWQGYDLNTELERILNG